MTCAPHCRMTKTALGTLLIGASLLFTALASQAQTVTVGGTGSNNAYPFGTVATIGHYQGEYQQIYSSSAFTGPITIRQIAFESASGVAAGSYSFSGTLGLGTTAISPTATGTSYAANKGSDFTTVFSGTQTATITGSGSTFDLVFNVTPFVYDPSKGNLFLDVVVTGLTTSGLTGFVFGSDTSVGRIFNSGGNGAPTSENGFGLLTRFDSGIAPEPGSLALVGVGCSVLGVVVRRRRSARRTA